MSINYNTQILKDTLNYNIWALIKLIAYRKIIETTKTISDLISSIAYIRDLIID